MPHQLNKPNLQTMQPDLILYHAEQLVTVDASLMTPENPLGVIPQGALAIKDGKIIWLGSTSALNLESYFDEDFENPTDIQTIDCSGQIILPGFVDSHTHPVFAGDRSGEFEQRLQGVSYLDIARSGGGIKKTVEATRKASELELYITAKRRLETMLSFGVTTVEGKSGYGLDWASEKKSLQVLQKLKREVPQSVCVTYMGAHDIPIEYKENPDDYVTLLCKEHLPEVAKNQWADFCDVFCETGYFTVEQSRRILETAKQHGLKLKIHAEEFTDLGGARLAGELGATSADHLLHISDESIQAMKQGQTVATLLPGTAFYLQLKDYAPARKILDAGVPVALATDFNPGSCMSENIQWTMTLACLNMGMTPAEVIQGVTINGAKALDLHHDRGSLELGKRADLVCFNVMSYNELLYHFGVNHLAQVYIQGHPIGI